MFIARTAVLALVLGLISPTAVQADSLDEEVKAAYAAWDAAFNKSDAAAIGAFYTPDAVFLPPTHVVMNGPEAVETFFAGLFEAGVTGHQLELVDANGSGDIIVAAAKWSAKGKDGSSLGGLATHQFAKQADGSLKLRLQTFN